MEAGDRAADYLKELDRDYKAKRKALKAKLDYSILKTKLRNQEITQRVFDKELEIIIFDLMDKKIIAAINLRKDRAELESGTINRKKYEIRCKKATQDLGYRKLSTKLKAGEITRDEFNAQFEEIVAELETYEVTEEELDAQREAIIRELESREITQEEFDAQDTEWRQEKTQKGAQLNKLKETFNIKIAKIRKGEIEEDVIWLEMYRAFGENPDEFSQLALSRRPLPKSTTTYVNSSMPTTLEELRSLVNERDLRYLQLADQLWSKLRYTNRQFWQAKVENWAKEIRQLGPALGLTSMGSVLEATEPELPSLCEPTPLAIDRLEGEEVEDLSQLPHRPGDVRPRDIASLLAALLAGSRVPESPEQANRTRQQPPSPSRQPSRSSGATRQVVLTAKELVEFLRMFARPSSSGDE